MAYRIEKNDQFNSHEIYFDGKPSEEVRSSLKALKMRWNHKKVCWYGFATEREIINALNGAGEAVRTEGYLGGGAYYGSKSNKYLHGAELSKAIREDLKAAKLPIKATVKVKTFSGGQEITVTAKMPESYYKTPEEYAAEKMEGLSMPTWLYTPEGQKHCDIINGMQWEQYEETMKYHYMEEYRLHVARVSNYGSGASCELLNEVGNEIISKISAIVLAFNFDESNGMVDYFHTNFYHTIDIVKVTEA